MKGGVRGREKEREKSGLCVYVYLFITSKEIIVVCDEYILFYVAFGVAKAPECCSRMC